MLKILAALLALAPLFAVAAGSVEPASQQVRALGFSPQRLERIDTFYQDKVQKGEMAGIVVLVARHGKVAHFSAIGFADAAQKTKMQKDSIFRLYSMTKPIAATALMMLYEEGAFRLDDPISKYIPDFKDIRVLRTPDAPIGDTVAAVREPTIHDLFRHTAGLSHGLVTSNPVDAAYTEAGITDPNVPLAEMAQRLAKIPLRYQPGTKFNYSLGQDLQARLVEIFSGMPFDAFLKTRLFDPLSMKDTGHWVTRDKASRLVSIHWLNEGQLAPMDDAHGYPKSDFALRHASDIKSYLEPHARLGGSYGLVGTALDYWRFAQMMENGGEFEGHRFLSPSTVRYMARDHLGSVATHWSGVSWGLGFAVVKDAAAAGSLLPDGSFYWAGAGNTLFWIDPKNDIVVVAMTQNMDPSRKMAGADALREQIGAMVYGALTQTAAQ